MSSIAAQHGMSVRAWRCARWRIPSVKVARFHIPCRGRKANVTIAMAGAVVAEMTGR